MQRLAKLHHCAISTLPPPSLPKHHHPFPEGQIGTTQSGSQRFTRKHFPLGAIARFGSDFCVQIGGRRNHVKIYRLRVNGRHVSSTGPLLCAAMDGYPVCTVLSFTVRIASFGPQLQAIPKRVHRKLNFFALDTFGARQTDVHRERYHCGTINFPFSDFPSHWKASGRRRRCVSVCVSVTSTDWKCRCWVRMGALLLPFLPRVVL